MRRVIRNFGLSNVTMLTITAGTGGTATALPLSFDYDVMIYNPGPLNVFVRTGVSTVTADATALIIPAGEKGVYMVGDTSPPVTHIATYATANQTVYVAQGYGS